MCVITTTSSICSIMSAIFYFQKKFVKQIPVNVLKTNENEPVTLSLLVRLVKLNVKWYFLNK